MKKFIIIFLLLNSYFLYAQGEFGLHASGLGYFNYGISTDSSSKTYHTLCQDLGFFGSTEGLNVFTFGAKLHEYKAEYFFAGYKYSLFFFSFGGYFLFGEGIGISPNINLVLPLLIINLKLFINYNIYFTQRNKNSLEVGFMIGVLDFIQRN